MKFKFVDEFEGQDKRVTRNYKKNNYDKNFSVDNYENITAEEKEKIAIKLAITPVDHKVILGYQTESPKDNPWYAKYNKETEDFVVYSLNNNNEPVVITFDKKTIREYNIDSVVNYIGEIPQ